MLTKQILRQIEAAKDARHRQLLLFSGPENNCLQLITELIGDTSSLGRIAWLGAGAPDSRLEIKLDRISGLLGSEFHLIVINAHSGFHCDAMTMLEGTLVAGGVLILATPPLQYWHTLNDPAHHIVSAQPATRQSYFIQRFVREVRATMNHVATQAQIEIHALKTVSMPALVEENLLQEQNNMIATLMQHVQESKNRCILLTADRGRGKSATLGRTIARLLSTTTFSVLISAPNKRAVQILQQHLRHEYTHNAHDKRCYFVPPDQLQKANTKVDLLVIDEASSIPLPILLAAAQRFRCTIMASTVKGYEGAGRGFALRLHRLLTEHTLPWQHEQLQQPIRWAHNDPLEAFVQSAFVMNAELPSLLPPPTEVINANLQLNFFSAKQLASDESSLRAIFGLLLEAHYKTTPNDLRHMLDGDNLSSCALSYDGHVIGAALIADEGCLHDLNTRCGIMQKKRRPNGHLLPQLLAQYTLTATALDLKIARIVRLAIHPAWQRRGLGSEMLRLIYKKTTAEGFDAIGAMFSAVPHTQFFWQKNGYTLCHKGARKQSSSGLQSITVLAALSEKAQHTQSIAHSLFSDSEAFRQPLCESKAKRSKRAGDITAALYDSFVLQQYAAGGRSFRDSHASLARLCTKLFYLCDQNPQLKQIIEPYREQLEALQKPDTTPHNLATSTPELGVKMVEAQLRDLITSLLPLT